MDEYISDEAVSLRFKNKLWSNFKNVENFQKFHAHAYAKPINKKIKVKTEKDIKNVLGIKLESPNNVMVTVSEAKTTPDIAWKQEKQRFIEQMMLLKSENLKVVRNLHDKDDEFNSVKLTNQTLEHRLSEMQAVINWNI